MAEIRLDPMTDEEFRVYLETAVPGYAEQHVRAGNWPAEGAVERSAEEYRKLLPDGPATPDHHLYTARDGDRRVGMVWFARRESDGGRPVGFVYHIQIDEQLRGQGYGEATFRALERQVRSAGLDTLQLHVFGHNTVARSLYAKLGYAETDVWMSRHLG